MKHNTPIPTLEIKNLVSQDLLKKYQKLNLKSLQWIPCEKELEGLDSFILDNWLERLYIQRLEGKSELIQELLNDSENDWEAVLFQLLAKNFGLKVNGEVFLKLAKSIPFSIIRKERHDLMKLSALFFGQAGFLSEILEDSYHSELKKEYEYLQHKYRLNPISKNEFLFFRMRPSNFPTLRIAQLVALYHQHHNLFSLVMEVKSVDKLNKLFKIDVPEFWETHYTFEKASKKRKKPLTVSFLELLFINTIVPLQFSYQKFRNELDEEGLFSIMKELNPEKNNITSKFSELKVIAKNAFESQGLLELKNNYCAKKRCLQCAIGNQLLTSRF
jgi:hypothetical protein